MKATTYEKRIIKKMKSVGTYKPEFENVISNLAQIFEDMDEARKQFVSSGGKFLVEHTNKNGSTNFVKNPSYMIIESLQKNVLIYSRELGLTPEGLKKINSDGLSTQKMSKLDEALFQLTADG